jgi:hypothetical protein
MSVPPVTRVSNSPTSGTGVESVSLVADAG